MCSTKRCLRKILSQAKLSHEEQLTAIAEVESVLNSRPLTYVLSEDLEEPLTPSHVMHGRRIMSLPHCLTDDVDEEVDSEAFNNRLKYLNRTLNSFWKRWRKEYLLELREAHRHYRSSGAPQIVIRDVVVVHVEGQPRGHWKLGVIERVMVGADGVVRAALVGVTTKGRSSTLCRPIQHLYPIEVRHTQEEATQEEAVNPEPRDDPERKPTMKRPTRDAAA